MRSSGMWQSEAGSVHPFLSQIRLSERLMRYSIAAFTVIVGLIGLVSAFSPDGAAGSPARVVAILLISASTLPVAFVIGRIRLTSAWWTKSAAGTGRVSTAFVAYADIGFTAGLLTFKDPLMCLHGTALFALIGGYVAHFARKSTMVLHLVYTTGLIICLAIASWLDGVSAMTAMYYASISLVAANGIVVLLRTYTDEFQQALAHQLDYANTDQLTGLLNRRGFMYLASLLVQSASGGFVVVIADVDHYKRINDLHGHAIGDAVLCRVADALAAAAGASAVVGRLGGDEFVVAFAGSGDALERLADSFRAQTVNLLVGERVTLSMGALAYPEREPDVAMNRAAAQRLLVRALDEADAALFRAKEAGRNTYTVVAGSDTD